MTAVAAYQWMLRICAVGLVIDALEQVATRRRYGEDALFAWSVLRRRYDLAPRFVRVLADAACAGAVRPMVAVAVKLVAIGVVVATTPGSTGFAIGLSVLVATQLYHFVRGAGLGVWGSDQMNLVILGGSWLAIVADGSADGLRAGLWFVAAQSALSYYINGAAKLAAPSWRSGRAFQTVFSTASNGQPTLHRVFGARPRLARLMAWGTMAWECGFALVLVTPEPVRIALLISGVAFHLTIAATMGIHLFVWAFVSPYAAIWFVTQ